MKRKVLFILAILLFFTKADAQQNQPGFGWSGVYKHSYIKHSGETSMCMNKSGDIYTALSDVSQIDSAYNFDPTGKSSNWDLRNKKSPRLTCIIKQNNNGNLKWVKFIEFWTIPGGNNLKVHLDDNENIYLLGNFTGIVDCDPDTGVFNLTSHYSGSPLIIKLDSTGKFLWAKFLLGEKNKTEMYLSNGFIDSDNNLLVTCMVDKILKIYPGNDSINFNKSGGAIVKFSPEGKILLCKNFSGGCLPTDLKCDDLNNIYITGYFIGKVDFDPSSDSIILSSEKDGDLNYSSDGFTIKLNSSGNLVWCKSYGGGGKTNLYSQDLGMAISIHNGSIYTLVRAKGYYWGDLLLIKYDSFGNVITEKYFSKLTIYRPTQNNLIINKDGELYIALDGGIAKFDNNLNLIWSRAIFNIQAIELYNEEIYFTGTGPPNDNHTIDFDPNQGKKISFLDTNTSFICKWTTCAEIVEDKYSACDNFKFNGSDFTESGIYNVVFRRKNGCDSIVKLNLKIYHIDSSLSTDGETIWVKYNLEGSKDYPKYQWVDCKTGQIIGGAYFDNFTPPDKGYYKCIIEYFDCKEESYCMNLNGKVNITSLEAFNISIFPNPTNDLITIQFNGFSSENVIEIYDNLGKKVLEEKVLKKDFIQVKMPEKKGIYFVIVRNDNFTKNYKVVKN